MEDMKYMDAVRTGIFRSSGSAGSPGNVKDDIKIKSPVQDRHARFFNMNHKKRGLALIFNHLHFEFNDLEDRIGTTEDSNMMSQCLRNLEFDVRQYDDLTVDVLLKKVDKIAKMDHKDNDCLVIVILTHGGYNGMIAARNTVYNVDQISQKLTSNNCPTLGGKPKIFFIQACLGENRDPGALFEDNLNCSSTFIFPERADFLYFYSTTPGFKSRRSWFIKELAEELNVNGYTEELVTLLIFVNRRIALTHGEKGNKQISCIACMLTRLIKFSPKGSAVDDTATEK